MMNLGLIELFIILAVGLIVALIIAAAAIFMLTRQPAATPGVATSPATGQTPLDILNLRSARGEINKEQYDQMKRDLGV